MIPLDHNSTRVLVVDDEEAIRRSFRSYLEDIGFQVDEASDGQQGLDCFHRNSAEVILTDLRMGNLNGLEFVAAIKAISPDTPVIIVSGTGTVQDAIEAIRRGASDYIVKPVQEMQELEVVIHRTLERKQLQLENRAYQLHLEELVNQRTNELRKLSRAVEQSPGSVVITDRQARIEYVNPKFCEISGYTREELIGQNPRLLKSGHTPPETYQEMWKVLNAGREWRGELLNKKKNGELYWEYALISSIKDETGCITHFLGAKEDITARRKAQEQVREQAALLDIAHDAIVVLDLHGKVHYFNRAAELLYGWTQQEMVGERVDSSIYRFCANQLAAAEKQVLEIGFWSGELEQQARTGRRIIVRSSRTLVRDEQGRPKGILVVNTDLTEQKKMENQLLRMQRVESVGRLANGVAHDLNNVLTPILMTSDLLRSDSQLSSEAREGCDLILASAQRGADIVKRLLLFSRGMDGNRRVLNPLNVIEETARMVRETFPKTVEFALRLPPSLWPMEGDATQIYQVLLNLCVNARDAMPTGGVLQLSAENIEISQLSHWSNPKAQPGPYVALRVLDNGTGIPPEIMDKIFDPFFTTKQVGQGTGLGLSSVLGIVKSHGGFLEVHSQMGQGTEFAVFFPANKEGRAPDQCQPAEPIRRGSGQLILVVDDEENLRRMLTQILGNHGYQVVTASNGFEALALYAQRKKEIKAIILDLWMPYMDGWAAIREFEKLNRSAPVIATSGLSHLEESVRLASPVVKAFLAKPWKSEELLITLDRVVRSTVN